MPFLRGDRQYDVWSVVDTKLHSTIQNGAILRMSLEKTVLQDTDWQSCSNLRAQFKGLKVSMGDVSKVAFLLYAYKATFYRPNGNGKISVFLLTPKRNWLQRLRLVKPLTDTEQETFKTRVNLFCSSIEKLSVLDNTADITTTHSYLLNLTIRENLRRRKGLAFVTIVKVEESHPEIKYLENYLLEKPDSRVANSLSQHISIENQMACLANGSFGINDLEDHMA